ncbi:restriction endonuclease subunit S [Clostridium sp. D2Q-14]|uniref:restriction endonuclease subunit S n=1 Tax=Anaeromonas gelatinilytica TaxID=2683194 RepID=UPI00193AF064|nr:restriction endonuclease subunit S [Anaeromonas gelatinilytica]MBS4536373.1 restriction endonuclease subunit S [Anaeromonas gelatinilytica]
MDYKRLGEISNIRAGGTPSRSKKEYWQNGNIPWLKIGNLNKKYINKCTEYITDQGLNNSSAKLFKSGTILYTIFATLGEVAILDIDSATNQAIAGIEVKDTNILTEYLYYYLKSIRRTIIDTGRGVAQNNINLRILRNLIVPIPTIQTQKKIVEILNKSHNLIDKRKEQIKLLDDLIQSIFYDMFGDPVTNPKGWDEVLLKDIIVNSNNGLARRGKANIGQIVLRLVELQNGFIDYSNVNRIELTDKEKSKYQLENNDFLFARVNGNPNYVGRCAVFKLIDEPVYHNDHIIRVHFDENILEGQYTSCLLNSDYGKKELSAQIKTSAGQYTISQDGLGKIRLLVPPIELQFQFSEHVKQINKMKIEMQKSLDEINITYKALMQQCFR